MFIFFYHLQSAVKYLIQNQIYFFFIFIELNTLTILPSLLCCACIKAAIKGLCILNIHQIDELIFKIIHCNKIKLIRTQRRIEQLLESYIQDIPSSPTRRCLAPINTSTKTNSSPRVK